MEVVYIGCLASNFGKTATVISLATCLTEFGFRVLVVDMSGDTTHYYFPDSTSGNTVVDVLRGSRMVQDVIIHSDLFDILPAPEIRNLYDRYFPLPNCDCSRFLLSAILHEKSKYNLEDQYDFVLIDALRDSMATDSAIAAANSIIIPVELSKYSLSGAESLLYEISNMKHRLHIKAKIDGIIISRFNVDYQSYAEICNDVMEFSGENGIDTYKVKIREFRDIGEVFCNRRSILKCTGDMKKDAIAFTLEFLERRGLQPRRNLKQN